MAIREELLGALRPPRVPGLIREWTEESKRLRVVVREDGDVDVEFHVRGRRGTPFEAHYVVPKGEEEEAAAEIAQFVDDLLAERLVYSSRTRLFRGTRRWLRPEELPRPTRPGSVVSWRGTYDA